MNKLIQDMNIGRSIQRLRKQRGLTQTALVLQMQLYGSVISETALSKIEGGYRNIKVSDLVILKQILCVDYDEFFMELHVDSNRNI